MILKKDRAMTVKPNAALYAITLILSAFLLFSVQPLFARMMLPLLGGAPAVWNTAMVFFQAALLAGYAYAHGTSRFLNIRKQAALHLALLCGFALFLPVLLPAGLQPPATSNPALWQLGVMAMIVGGPFFIIAASAPMFQRWFSASDHKDAANPYFLYAASNIGSMGALLSYPLLVEPMMSLHEQSYAWAWGYGGLIAMTLLCASMVWRSQASTARPTAQSTHHSPWSKKIIWMVLAFIPSSLMLGVTTLITTDIASVPLLWVVPLALYLATFIIVFARREWVTIKMTVTLFTLAVMVLVFLNSTTLFDKTVGLFTAHLAVFFFACLLCHKKLADLRPEASELTAFYMYMSLGGVLGGMFNALLAPVLFTLPLEYVFVLCAALVVRALALEPAARVFQMPHIMHFLKSPGLWLAMLTLTIMPVVAKNDANSLWMAFAVLTTVTLFFLRHRPLGFAAFAAAMLLLFSPLLTATRGNVLHTERNFFGVLRVAEDYIGARSFYHGTTLHGAQPKSPKHRMIQITYYNPHGPIGDIFSILDKQSGPQKVGVLGLGVGTLACYTHPDRSFDFYEIDPAVVKIAEDPKMFTYLSDCGSPYKTIIGDGRLTLNDAPDASYDVLILDAFSSDNIPMHLLTLEALRTYMSKVKANGMIVFNISNRFIDLEYQLSALSQATAVPALAKRKSGDMIAPDSKLKYASSNYVVLTPNPDTILRLMQNGEWATPKAKPDFRLWTDDYANILSSLMVLD
jgi:hypothetical protein